MAADARPPGAGLYARVGKRLFDLTLTVPLLIALSPLYALLVVAVRAMLGAPPLFRQWRPGELGRPFLLLKFRSMRELVDGRGQPLPDADRLTRFGRLLRRTSLDELPELWNVLRGEMSLVGPRPLRMRYLERYSAEQARRHQVRPGVTGWAQIRGRNAMSWDAKLRLDVWYVDHLSFALDLRILAGTGWAVLSGKGISAPGYATMPEFMGSRQQRPEEDRDGP
jgi:lipopolysaccharide/colanic/teichoic acid biosynthesis glycosyltransferase